MYSNYLSYIATEIFFMIVTAVLLLRLLSHSHTGKEVRILRIMFILYLILLFTDIFWALTEDNILRPPVFLNALINAAADCIITIGCYCWCRFILERMHFSDSLSRLSGIFLMLPAAAICTIDLLSIFTGWFFFIDASGHYQDAPLFNIQGIVNYCYLIIPTVWSVVHLIRTHSRQDFPEYAGYLLYFIPLAVVTYLEDILPNVPLMAMSILLALLILFLSVYVDQEKAILKQGKELAETHAAILEKEQELSESRMSIMLSQIQPHFLYNVLVAIQAMCHGKAPEAEKTTIEFSQFLRGNLDSLTQRTPILFTKELEHTKNYLSLEVTRFGDDTLHIIYDIRATDFRIPALSLQPVVENAVRYGVMQREDGGTVTISTEDTGNAYLIKVTDDGVGFDVMTPKSDGRTHIGISNVRSRIEKMCGGTLEIKSIPDKGTKAVITIPKKNLPE
ncbi:MAG: histidine kinase [Lachnospiraceae bacterium]|jgi:hypothetical protein|nr:histidine kinase [Lachnospiraceae bacterium]